MSTAAATYEFDAATFDEIPPEALEFDAALEFAAPAAAAADGTQEFPVRILALTGNPVTHPYWGRVVHDLATMIAPPTFPIDYTHDSAEVLGLADRAEASDALRLAGRLISLDPRDRAAEVARKGRAGVPYQASINMGVDFTTEEVPEGLSATVNGRVVHGPITIFRNWLLRGVAICPYGTDPGTRAEFAGRRKPFFRLRSQTPKELQMSADEKAAADKAAAEKEAADKAAAEKAAADKEAADKAAAEKEAADKAAAEKAAAEKEAAEKAAAGNLAATPGPGQKFLDAFGQDGGVWFAQGKSFDEAQILFGAKLKADLAQARQERDELRARLAALGQGEKSPVKFQAETPPDGSATAPAGSDAAKQQRLERNLGPNLAKMAGAMKLAGAAKQ